MDIFLTQTHRFASKGLYKPPELCGALMHSKTEMAIHSGMKTWKSQDFMEGTITLKAK